MAIRSFRLGKVVGDRPEPIASIWPDTPRPGTPGDDTITGTPENDTLYGDGGDDSIYGVGGSDYLSGGAGSDRLEGGDSWDTLEGGDDNDTLLGGRASDSLYGGPGDDILDGGSEADNMYGGTGDDIYYVDKIVTYGDRITDFNIYPGDEIVELAGEGFDTVYVGLANYDRSYQFGVDHYGLGDDEIEVLAARDPQSWRVMKFAGNAFANAIYGAANSDGFGDELWGRGGDDVLHGLGSNDQLYGEEGNDILVGGTDNDTMRGGTGNDTCYADSSGDLIFEAAGEGMDRVAASTSLFLMADQEIEILDAVNLTSTNAMNLAGTNSDNVVSGNNGANELYGRDGNDVLNGAGGDDVLDGGGGNDSMTGGLGNDIYYVDSASDAVVELAGEGTDRVAAGASFALSANASIEALEAATPTGTAALDLTGSEIGQTISGNNGANTLSGMGGNDILFGLDGLDTLIGGEGNDFLVGGAGADMMTGGAGSDTYYVDDSGDTVSESTGEGSDRVATSVSFTLGAGAEIEALEAVNLNDDHAMDLTGNEFDNVIVGNHGANRIDGREGNDLLIGSSGADLFAFTTALGANNVDRIGDFGPGEDRMLLDSEVFAGLADGALPQGAFAVGTQAGEADDRIIYDPATGALFFDADGTGAAAAVRFATLGPGLNVSASDFLVI